jgi:3-dehydroquinate dehydratase-2
MPPARRILVLHGPNLNLLPGARSLEAIDAALAAKSVALGIELKTFQSNWEGGLLDTLAAQREWFEAVIINPATLAPSAVGLAEAIKLLKRPAIEVQLDDAKKGKSALKDVVEKQIAGKGIEGYLDALLELAPKKATAKGGKSIGPAVDRNVGRVLPNGEIVKSIGSSRQRLLSKKAPPPSAPRTLGRKSEPVTGVLSRAVVRQKIADRLSGALTPSSLSAWARAEWSKVQSGSAMESGQREKLEDVLQQLLLSATAKTSDDQLIELMTQLSE